MAASATNDKVIRIRSDINAAIADAKRLQAAYASIGGVNPALSQMVNNLTGASGATQRLGGAMAAANNNVAGLSGRLGGLGQAAQAAMSRLSGMTGTMGGIATAGLGLGLTAAAGGLIALGTAAVKTSAQFQAYRASLTTVLGDSDKAAQAFDRLTEFAQKTPFSLEQSVEGFIKMKALGLTPTESALTSFGNTAAATNHQLSDMIDSVAAATTGEFDGLKKFGITAKQNGDKVALTFQNVTKTIGNNAIEIQKYMMAIGNTQFAGAMDKQMQTFGGALSNLEDNVTQTFAKIGDAGLTASIAKVINMLSDGLTSMSPILVALGRIMGSVVDAVVSVGSGIGSMFAGLFSNGGKGLTFVETLTVAMNLLGIGIQGVGQVMGATFSAMGQIIGGVVGTIRGWFVGLWDWLTGSSSVATNSVSLNFIGVLRAVKYLASNLQNIFSAALSAIGGAFGVLGTRIMSFLSGNWSAFDGMGAALKGQFTSVGKLVSDTSKEMGKLASDSKGAAAAWERLKGNTAKKSGATLDQLAGPTPKPQPKPAKDDKDAAKKAAEKLKRENEFWQTLKDQLATAGMLTNEAELYNKQAELRKILEHDLDAGAKSRIATALSEIDTAKAITGLRQQAFEAANQYTVELGRQNGLTEAQKAIEDTLFKSRLDALNKNVDINSAAYKLAEADLKKQLEKNSALAQQNELLKRGQEFRLSMSDGARATDDRKKLDDDLKAYLDGVSSGKISGAFKDQVLAGYDAAKLKIEQDAIRVLLDMSPSLGRQARVDGLNADAKKARAQLDSLTLSPEARKQAEADIQNTLSSALGAVAAETTREWVDQFDDLADYFGGRMGDVLKSFGDGFDRIAKMMSGQLTGPAGFFAKLLGKEGAYEDAAGGFSVEKLSETIKNPLGSLKDGFNDFKGLFQSDLAGGLVKGLTKMQAGGQIGGMVAGVGDLLGLGKGFSTGASLGGQLGGLFGPIGSIIGSLGGGLIGSLFGSTKWGTASLTGANPASISGNAGSIKTAATGAAGSVQEGLQKLASELGGTVGAFSVAIGQWNGKWRVNDNATDKQLHFNNFNSSTLHDFGKDGEAAAIAYAIQNAIADGAIQGLAPIIQKALQTLGTDSAVQFAKDWTAAMKDYKSIIDPIGSAVEGIITPLKTLRETMVKVGASTEDLTKIDDYRTLKLKEALKQQLSSLTDFLAQLRGDGSGTTKLDQLNSKMAEFDALSARIKSGDSSVDQKTFTSLGQSIFGLAGDVYGTATSQFQDIRSMLIGTSQTFSDNITKAFNTAAGYDVANSTTSIDNTTAAIQAQAADAKAFYANQAASNAVQESYLKQIAANTNAAAAPASSTGAPAYNGRYLGSTY